MHINITGHQVEVTPNIRTFTQNKFKRLENHFDRIVAINVVFKVEKLRQIAEATVSIPGEDIHATSESEDLYAAIDLLVDKLNRQLTKHKEKILEHRDHREKDHLFHRGEAE
jgi:putative sigma-54 modulation protein